MFETNENGLCRILIPNFKGKPDFAELDRITHPKYKSLKLKIVKF